MKEEIIYTDGRGVKITKDKFYTENKTFNLQGITKVNMSKDPATKGPGIVLFIIGFISILLGSIDMFSNFEYGNYIVEGNMFAIGLGVFLLLAGIIWLVMARDKYAVEIYTAEGEKKPIISKNRDYVAMIVASLKKAYYRYVKHDKRNTVVVG